MLHNLGTQNIGHKRPIDKDQIVKVLFNVCFTKSVKHSSLMDLCQDGFL